MSGTMRWWLVLTVLFLSGCGPAPEPTLRVGTNLWLGYEPFYVARALHLFDDRSVRLVELPSSTEVLHALRGGQLEAAALTLDEVLTLRREGIALRVPLILDLSSGADAVVAAPPFESMADLFGRRVGVEQSAVGALLLEAALREAGMRLEDVEVVSLPPQQQEDAFNAGKVAAVVTFEPMRSRLVRAGGRVLFDSRRMEGRIVDVLALTEAAAASPAAVAALVGGWREGLQLLTQRRDEAIAIMDRRQRIGPAALATALTGLTFADAETNRRYLTGERPELARLGSELGACMVRHRLLAGPPDLTGLIAATELGR